jgi:hypothetical protein
VGMDPGMVAGLAEDWTLLALYARTAKPRAEVFEYHLWFRGHYPAGTSAIYHAKPYGRLIIFSLQFIAVHVRRTDFSEQCTPKQIATSSCFPPLSAYAKHMDDIKRAWVAKNGLNIHHILVMSGKRSTLMFSPRIMVKLTPSR